MNQINDDLIEGKLGDEPLLAYPWQIDADRLIVWSSDKSNTHRAFCFDLLMTLAYIDLIPDFQKYFIKYADLPSPYNIHVGFINLCVPLLIKKQHWLYQKAAKPQSGAIGKLTSEIILRFIQLIFDDFKTVKSLGGSGVADAVLIHHDGRIILCEIKASPLTTFPLLFVEPPSLNTDLLQSLTRTQIQSLDSGLYLHCDDIMPLGKPKDELWPFKNAINFIIDTANRDIVEHYVEIWSQITGLWTT